MVDETEWKVLERIARARGGRLLKVSSGKRAFLSIECRCGHIFSQTLDAILTGAWCPICKKHKRDLYAKRDEQRLYEVNRLYALSILAYEYPQWFHLGPPYLPPMRRMQNFLMKQLQEKYPDLTQAMIESAILFIKNQPDYYTCLLQPGPRYRPDGSVDEGKPLPAEKAEKYRQKYLHPSYQPSYVVAYTDGGCPMHENPWHGTWAYVIYDINSMRLLASASGNIYPIDHQGEVDTVNLAELTAAIMALYWCEQHGAVKVQIRSDSLLVTDPKPTPPGKKRKRRHFSKDLLTACDLYYGEVRRLGKRLVLQKVKGHSKIWENELVDAMCRRRYAQEYRRGSVVMKKLAAERHKPWVQRQIIGARIQFRRKMLRRCLIALRRVAIRLGKRLLAFGEGGRKKRR